MEACTSSFNQNNSNAHSPPDISLLEEIDNLEALRDETLEYPQVKLTIAKRASDGQKSTPKKQKSQPETVLALPRECF